MNYPLPLPRWLGWARPKATTRTPSAPTQGPDGAPAADRREDLDSLSLSRVEGVPADRRGELDRLGLSRLEPKAADRREDLTSSSLSWCGAAPSANGRDGSR
jgi:hypothetical protein